MPRFVLYLNPVTDRLESSEPKAWSEDRESLIRWMLNQRHQGEDGSYVDEKGKPRYWKHDRFYKHFRKGSPLEWCNPLDEHAFDAQDGRSYAPNHYGHGIQEHMDVEGYLELKRVEYDQFYAEVPDIGIVHPDEVRVARILMEGEDPA